MKSREALIVAVSEEALKHYVNYVGMADVQDITALMEPTQYGSLPRAGVSVELTKKMPQDTHQRVSVIMPRKEDESIDDWTLRVWTHPIISIISSSFRLQMPIAGGVSYMAT